MREKLGMNNQIKEAIQIFNQGGIVIFPTDTSFGIGCRIDNEAAIEKLFTLRKRPVTQAASVLVSDIAMAEEYVTGISENVLEKLIKPYWPGGLTVVLPSNLDKVPVLVRGGTHTIGIRMPDYADLLTIISGVGVPILGPSANFHGHKTPFQQKDLDEDLLKLVDYVVEGNCKNNKASTVIDCTIIPWKVLREGAVTLPYNT